MRRIALGWAACVFATVLPLPSLGDQITDLEETVAKQGRLIEQLMREVGRLREQADSEVEAAVSAGPGPSEQGTVTTAYVDERIQDFEDTAESRFLISGYGTAFLAVPNGEKDRFGSSFNPGFHFRMADRLHLNAELEIELEVGDGDLETHFDLEFAQIDFLATDWLTVSGGKFVTPFATFGTRGHPTWINKMATVPPIYGGYEGGGILPVLKNIGAMASGGTALWSDDAKINYGVYLANGAKAAANPMNPRGVLDIDFDNAPNLENLTTGGRIGFLPIGNLEFGASYMTGDPENARFHLAGLDAAYSRQGLELRSELIYLTRSASGIDADVWGYWAQAAYRLRYLFPETTGLRGFLNRLEGVVRWGQIFDFDPANRKQLALGLNFWLFESAPLKLNYEVNSGTIDANRFFLQFAYGF